jgi:glyoxylase-like metal-dependent hydrolase (beta-lactamase superfamily II)
MGTIVRLRVGDIDLTRVPYFDIPLDASVVSLTADAVRAIPWAQPTWATPEGEVRVGQALWVARSGGRVVVIDPCGASDAFLRAGPEAIAHQDRVREAMTAAGVPASCVDAVVLTHLDGIGMAAAVNADDEWSPLFPNARVVITQAELDFLATDPDVSGLPALRALITAGAVDGVDDGHEVARGITLSLTGGHSPGHAVVWVRSGDEEAVLLGHLALTPLHLVTPMSSTLHIDADAAAAVLAGLVAAAEAGTVVIGPLWPEPGAVTVDRDGVLPISAG